MNKLSLSFSCSFLLHGLLVLGGLSIGSVFPLLDPPVVIDFTLVKRLTPSPRKTIAIAEPQQIQPSSAAVTTQKTDEPSPPLKVEPLTPPIALSAITQPKPTLTPPLAKQKKTITKPVPLPTADQETLPIETTASLIHVEESVLMPPIEEAKPLPPPILTADREASPVKTTASSSPESSDEDTGAVAQQIYLKQHFEYIKETIQKKICYPGIARKMGWEGKVVVSFVVKKNGDIQDMKVVHSSGYKALDKNAMTTIKKAAPFPNPPITAEVIIPIIYRLG